MIRLSPRHINSLAACILGDENEFGFDYRTHAQLSAFFGFANPDSRPESDDGSRATRAINWLSAANRDDTPGGSDLPGEWSGSSRHSSIAGFGSDDAHEVARTAVSELLGGLPVEVVVGPDRSCL